MKIKRELAKDLEKETAARIKRFKEEMKLQNDFDLTVFENIEGYDQIILMKRIKEVALCEHHECEFSSTIHCGYIPEKWLMGASKFVRIVRSHLNLDIKTLQERA